MAAFSPYRGAYQFAGQTYVWRCYSTRPVYAGRLSHHAANEPPPEGRRWVRNERHPSERCYMWLVDEDTQGVSQILSQIAAEPPGEDDEPAAPRRRAQFHENRL